MTRTEKASYDAAYRTRPAVRERERVRSAHRRGQEAKQIKARERFNNAVRNGRIVRASCEVCGDPDTEGHHPDYDKPLEVMWLCPLHHREKH